MLKVEIWTRTDGNYAHERTMDVTIDQTLESLIKSVANKANITKANITDMGCRTPNNDQFLIIQDGNLHKQLTNIVCSMPKRLLIIQDGNLDKQLTKTHTINDADTIKIWIQK